MILYQYIWTGMRLFVCASKMVSGKERGIRFSDSHTVAAVRHSNEIVSYRNIKVLLELLSFSELQVGFVKSFATWKLCIMEARGKLCVEFV